MSPSITPQDRPNKSANEGSYGPDDNGNSGGGSMGQTPMQQDLEVAQACLNLRQDQSKNQQGAPPNGNGNPASNGGGSGGGDTNSASQTPHQMDSRSNMMNSMTPMPPINGGGGAGAGGRNGEGSRLGTMPMQQMQMPGSFMPSHMMDLAGGPLPGGIGGIKDIHPGYYNNMVESGHFPYSQFPSSDAEQYHAMMNGMGAMRDMTYYNMMNQGDGGMMNPSTQYFTNMMAPHDTGHFAPMMNNSYPQVQNTYMQQQKRPHPDDYGVQNDFKRRRANNASPSLKPGDEGSVRSKKSTEKNKKGKRASDMPRRPLSAYNFFFSEERERILAAIPDPDGEKKEDSPTKNEDDKEKAGDESKDKKEGGEEDKPKGESENTPEKKMTQDEINEKMAARSKRLLALREQQSNKRRPHRKTHGKIGFKELVKKIGERWRALPADQKEYYSGLAETDLRRYKEQMTEYNTKNNRIGS